MRSHNRHSIFFQVSPPGAFGKPRQILPDSRQHRPAFRPIRRHDPSLSPQTVLDKPLRWDLWKAGPLEKHSGPFSRIPAVRPASDGDFFFSCLIHVGREGVSAYFTRTAGREAVAENTRQTPVLLQILCCLACSALSFFPQVFHSFDRREIGFSVAQGDPDVVLTGDFGGDP